jgi:hypothetical protein
LTCRELTIGWVCRLAGNRLLLILKYELPLVELCSCIVRLYGGSFKGAGHPGNSSAYRVVVIGGRADTGRRRPGRGQQLVDQTGGRISSASRAARRYYSPGEAWDAARGLKLIRLELALELAGVRRLDLRWVRRARLSVAGWDWKLDRRNPAWESLLGGARTVRLSYSWLLSRLAPCLAIDSLLGTLQLG